MRVDDLEFPRGGRELTLRAAELLEHQVGQGRVAFGHMHGILQTLVVRKHWVSPVDGKQQ